MPRLLRTFDSTNVGTVTEDGCRAGLAPQEKVLKDESLVISDKAEAQHKNQWTGGWFGSGIVSDVKNRLLSQSYLRDWQLLDRSNLEDIDGGFQPTLQDVIMKILAATMYIFFMQVLPALVFSLLLSQRTENAMGTEEVLLSMAIGGTMFAIFSGQPLVLVGVTGPIVILIVGIYDISIYPCTREVIFDWLCFGPASGQ